VDSTEFQRGTAERKSTGPVMITNKNEKEKSTRDPKQATVKNRMHRPINRTNSDSKQPQTETIRLLKKTQKVSSETQRKIDKILAAEKEAFLLKAEKSRTANLSDILHDDKDGNKSNSSSKDKLEQVKFCVAFFCLCFLGFVSWELH
jgi:hypothetical protein